MSTHLLPLNPSDLYQLASDITDEIAFMIADNDRSREACRKLVAAVLHKRCRNTEVGEMKP